MPAARLRLRRAVIAASVSLGFATYAYAVPVNYQFTTGPVTGVSTFLGPNQAALDALSGLSVTGTFTYDSDVPQSGTTNGPIVFGQSDYAGALSNFSASVGGFTVTAPSGVGSVANEGYSNPVLPGGSDFFQIGLAQPVSGFTLGAVNLVAVGTRLFWIENSTGNTLDFLNDNSLPTTLPTSTGRLAVDFLPVNATPGDFSGLNFAFFENLQVTAAPVSVPEPSAWALLALSSVALLIVAPRRRARPGYRSSFS
jgi:hypothetical protein